MQMRGEGGRAMAGGDYILSAVVGIVTGVLSAALWLAIIYRVRPRIDIAKQIRLAPADRSYQIKVINRSHQAAVNVKAQLTLLIPTKAGGDEFNTSTVIPLRRSELMQLSGADKQDSALPVFRFVTDENLQQLLAQNPRAWLAFRMMATHPITHFGDIYKMDYHARDIVEGNFDSVASMRILPTPRRP